MNKYILLPFFSFLINFWGISLQSTTEEKNCLIDGRYDHIENHLQYTSSPTISMMVQFGSFIPLGFSAYPSFTSQSNTLTSAFNAHPDKKYVITFKGRGQLERLLNNIEELNNNHSSHESNWKRVDYIIGQSIFEQFFKNFVQKIISYFFYNKNDWEKIVQDYLTQIFEGKTIDLKGSDINMNLIVCLSKNPIERYLDILLCEKLVEKNTNIYAYDPKTKEPVRIYNRKYNNPANRTSTSQNVYNPNYDYKKSLEMNKERLKAQKESIEKDLDQFYIRLKYIKYAAVTSIAAPLIFYFFKGYIFDFASKAAEIISDSSLGKAAIKAKLDLLGKDFMYHSKEKFIEFMASRFTQHRG